MDTKALHATDKFSWRRVINFGRFYQKTAVCYLIAAAALSLISYLLVLLVNIRGAYVMPTYSLVTMLLAAASYFGPLIFSRRYDTLLAQIPATAAEKLTYYILFSLVAVPLAVQGIWYGTNFIFSLINPDFDLTELIYNQVDCNLNLNGREKLSQFLFGFIQLFAIITTTLYIVLKAKTHRTLKAIASVAGIIIALGVVAGIAGGIIAVNEITNHGDISNPAYLTDPNNFTTSILDKLMPLLVILYSVLSIYGIFILTRIYRLLAHPQVKA